MVGVGRRGHGYGPADVYSETRCRVFRGLFESGDQMEDPAGEPGEGRRRLPCRHNDRHGRRDRFPRNGPHGAQGREVPVQQRRLLDAERGLARVGQSRRVRRERFHRPAGKRGVHRPLRGPAGEDRGRCRQEGSHVQRGTHRTGRAGKRLGHCRESDRHDGRFEGVRPLADVVRPAAQEFPGLSSSLDSRGGKTMDRKKREGSGGGASRYVPRAPGRRRRNSCPSTMATDRCGAAP